MGDIVVYMLELFICDCNSHCIIIFFDFIPRHLRGRGWSATCNPCNPTSFLKGGVVCHVHPISFHAIIFDIVHYFSSRNAIPLLFL